MIPFLGQVYSELESQLKLLERRLSGPDLALPAISDSSDYDLDVRGYCVVSHGAFEEYFEGLCLRLMIDAGDGWIETRDATTKLLSFLAFGPEIKIDVDEKHAEQKLFDYIRKALNERKDQVSRFLKQNNGVSPKYLRQMLLPVGLDVPDNPLWIGSLNQLAKERGKHAHAGYVHTIPSPDIALQWVADCLGMCAHIRNAAQLL